MSSAKTHSPFQKYIKAEVDQCRARIRPLLDNARHFEDPAVMMDFFDVANMKTAAEYCVAAGAEKLAETHTPSGVANALLASIEGFYLDSQPYQVALGVAITSLASRIRRDWL